MSLNNFLLLSSLLIVGCNYSVKSQDYATQLNEKEQLYSKRAIGNKLIKTIECFSKTSNTKDFPDGKLPWIDIENKEKTAQVIIDGEELVIEENIVTILIDYPLNNPYRFEIKSEKGFTRAQLVRAIIENYYKIYEQEERSAIIKTIPVNERKTMYNRNQTDGTYGIWGHDIGDLSLADIEVNRTADGKNNFDFEYGVVRINRIRNLDSVEA